MSTIPGGPITVSVVVPCFNTHRTLPRTLASLRAQSAPPLEIVVVDDGSTDPETVAFVSQSVRNGNWEIVESQFAERRAVRAESFHGLAR